MGGLSHCGCSRRLEDSDHLTVQRILQSHLTIAVSCVAVPLDTAQSTLGASCPVNTARLMRCSIVADDVGLNGTIKTEVPALGP